MDFEADRNHTVTAFEAAEASEPEAPALAVTPPAVPNGLQRDAETGRFTRANGDAAKHWLHSDRLPPELEHLRDEVSRFLSAAVTDDGGEDEVPTRRLALLEYRSRLHRRIGQIDAAIELRGLFDRRGKLRTTWLTMLATLVDKARGLDALLGLQRRARHVDPMEAVRQAVADANRRATERDAR